MHPIRELYVLLLASLRGMIVLNFIKSFSWNRFSTRFSSLSLPLSCSSLPNCLTDWLADWLAIKSAQQLDYWLWKRLSSKFMQNCWKMVATVNEPSTRAELDAKLDPNAICVPYALCRWRIFYAIVFRSINLKNEWWKDKKRYEAKKPPRLVKYWLLVFEMGFKLGLRLGIAMSMGASDSWTTDGLG